MTIFKRQIKEKDIIRFEADIDYGLNDDEVKSRQDDHLTNKTKKIIGKSYPEIFIKNLCTFYNILLCIIAVLLIYGEMYFSLFFIVVYLANLIIGLYQDIKARKLLNKLQLITQAKVSVLRNGKISEIYVDDIVLDDIVILKASNQVPADGVLLDSTLGVNNSILTGESQTVYLNKGDTILSGSYITSGSAKVRIIRVGKDNYVNQLEKNARKKKASKSRLKKDLDNLFRVIGTIVITVSVLTFAFQWNDLLTNFRNTIGPIAGSLVSMIPAGLYLLSSVTLTVGVINLYKKRTMVQDFYALEMLARSNSLCLDKTGTITDGTMNVVDLVLIDNKYKKEQIELLIANIIESTKDENATAKALKKAFPFEGIETANYVSSFNSDNKYSFVTFKKDTYALGAIDGMNATNKQKISSLIKDYASSGKRVLVLAKAKERQLDGTVLKSQVDVIAIIVLEDHIKEDAKETIKWFQDNGVKVRVISGDDALTVSQIARRVDINNASDYISLAGLNNEEVKEAALKYTVFGRVTPEQKEILIDTLKQNGDTVAMTGDGVNDILALRKADCSIAMANGSDAAKNVSQLVMLDSDFSSLPSVVAEGRRVINNLQRTCSLFLVKTMFAMFLSIVYLILGFFIKDVQYPFLTNHLYLWEFTVIGLGSFFVALEPNKELLKGNFITNILKGAIPGAVMMLLSVGIMELLKYFQLNHIVYTGVFNDEIYLTMCFLIFSILPLANLYRVCTPFSKYRLIVFLSMLGLNILGLSFGALLEYTIGFTSLFGVSFKSLIALNYIEVIVIIVALISVYLIVTEIINLLINNRKEKKENA